MRIQHIINYAGEKGGGAGKVVGALCDGLETRGIESRVLSLAGAEPGLRSRTASLGFRSPYRLRVFPDLIEHARKHILPGDILHLHLFPAILYGSMLRRFWRFPNPVLCTEHNTFNRRRGTAVGKLIDRLTYSGCDAIAAISQGTHDELVAWRPDLQKRVRVVSNGINLVFDRFIEREDTGRPIILSVGRLHPQKNYIRALEALSLLPDIEFEYHIAGAGDEEVEMRRVCIALGIEGRVKFLGHIDDLYAVWKRSHIFLMPSLWEGFGLAAVEAMNAGLAPIVSDVPGLREIVDSELPCALIIDPASPRSIASGLAQLLNSHELRTTLGKRSFERAKGYSVDRMVEAYVDLYSEIADNNER